MRCPYCNNLNSDRATFCANCGRDLRQAQATRIAQYGQPAQSSQQPASSRPQSPYPQQSPSSTQRSPVPVTSPVPPYQSGSHTQQPATRPAQSPYTQPSPQSPARTRGTTSATASSLMGSASPTTQVQPSSTPPTTFPPRTIEQLNALEASALSYAIINEAVGDGRKRIVRITYRACPAWQQAATLLKAFREQLSDRFDTIIIQGVANNAAIPYTFNNGQLRFDHNVRLGSQLTNRYIIETGTGLESDAVRIVLQAVGI